MANHTKERLQEILQYKIDSYTQKHINFIKNNIDPIKTNRIAVLRDKFIAEKAIVDAS